MHRTATVILLALVWACSSESTGPAAQGEVCEGYLDQSSTPYVLPWAVGASFSVGSQNCRAGSPTHSGIARYAYDFIMPIGTPVHAVRAGVVVGTDDRFVDGNGVPGNENQIFVQHEDGTVARYYHLTSGGVLVEVGDMVTQGQHIGSSGNTGNTTAPHLHFDVTQEDCGEAFFGPRCITVPLTFSNTRPHPNGLQRPEFYTAEPF